MFIGQHFVCRSLAGGAGAAELGGGHRRAQQLSLDAARLRRRARVVQNVHSPARLRRTRRQSRPFTIIIITAVFSDLWNRFVEDRALIGGACTCSDKRA